MLPVTPSKKPLTDDKKDAIDASNAYCNSVVPEDLHIALQNLGSRVRKSVIEGFGTQYLTTFTVPATPYSSPAKLPSTQMTPTPIFRSANDAFKSVFPAGGLRVPLTPSPKKRSRAEVEHGEAKSRRILDSDVEMDAESEVEDDQLRSGAPSNVFSPPRKIKSLRRSTARIRGGDAHSDPFTFTSQDVGQRTASLDAMEGSKREMDVSEEAKV